MDSKDQTDWGNREWKYEKQVFKNHMETWRRWRREWNIYAIEKFRRYFFFICFHHFSETTAWGFCFAWLDFHRISKLWGRNYQNLRGDLQVVNVFKEVGKKESNDRWQAHHLQVEQSPPRNTKPEIGLDSIYDAQRLLCGQNVSRHWKNWSWNSFDWLFKHQKWKKLAFLTFQNDQMTIMKSLFVWFW